MKFYDNKKLCSVTFGTNLRQNGFYWYQYHLVLLDRINAPSACIVKILQS
jgi:hypothetical protein